MAAMTPRRNITTRLVLALGLAAATLLAACSPEEEAGVATTTAPDDAAPSPQPSDGLILQAAEYADLPGWTGEDFAGVAQAFSRSCAQLAGRADDRKLALPAAALRIPDLTSHLTAGDFRPACTALATLAPPAETPYPEAWRRYFSRHFTPYLAIDAGDDSANGLFTGYFEAALDGARRPGDGYQVPLYAPPADLVSVDLGAFDTDLAGRNLVGRVRDGRLVPYATRGEIEGGYAPARGSEILWLNDPVDAFLLQVQGSGRITLPDGGETRIGFAAHNGHPYRSIGQALIAQGELPAHAASWPGIRGWIRDNPARAAELFAVNPRFIFFRELATDGPIGAQGVVLTPRRSLAVDRRFVPLGLPVWLDTVGPGSDGTPLRRLMLAQDTGGAIKGPVRGDFYWGSGDAALAEAGRMKSRGRYFLLIPNMLVARLAAAPS